LRSLNWNINHEPNFTVEEKNTRDLIFNQDILTLLASTTDISPGILRSLISETGLGVRDWIFTSYTKPAKLHVFSIELKYDTAVNLRAYMKISLSKCRNSGLIANHHLLCIDKPTPSVTFAIFSRYISKKRCVFTAKVYHYICLSRNWFCCHHKLIGTSS